MGFIKNKTVDENKIDEYWESYREISNLGITHYSDEEIRDLYAKLSMSLANYELLASDYEINYERAKVEHGQKRALLLAKSSEKAVNQKVIDVESNQVYLESEQEVQNRWEELIVVRQHIKALNAATSSLSREISARISK